MRFTRSSFALSSTSVRWSKLSTTGTPPDPSLKPCFELDGHGAAGWRFTNLADQVEKRRTAGTEVELEATLGAMEIEKKHEETHPWNTPRKSRERLGPQRAEEGQGRGDGLVKVGLAGDACTGSRSKESRTVRCCQKSYTNLTKHCPKVIGNEYLMSSGCSWHSGAQSKCITK